MSSISHPEALEFAAIATGVGLRWIDASVSAGTPAAGAGTLSIMAGSAGADIEAARPLLVPMGRIVHIGPAGTGALTKLITLASTIATVAMMLAEAGGADSARVCEALIVGFAASRIMELPGQRMIERNFAPGGPARYQLKDTMAARQVVERLGLELPVLNLAHQLFEDLIAHGGAIWTTQRCFWSCGIAMK